MVTFKNLRLLLVILVFAFVLRVIAIDLRPLHNDEGVNWYFINGMASTGYYKYSHENYHGPLYFYITKYLRDIVGDSELGLRASAIMFGLATVWIVSFAGLVAPLFMALSAAAVFYSRYAIHESLLVFASFLFGYGLYQWLKYMPTKVCRSWWYLAGLAFAVMVATKETFPITVVAILIGLSAAFGWRTMLLVFWPRNWLHLLFGVSVVSFLILAAFTGGFRWMQGWHELYAAFGQWFGRGYGDTGHFKPWHYYLKIILQSEPYLLVAPLLTIGASVLLPGVVISKLKQDDYRWTKFVAVWFIIELVIYSIIKYKTPWLVLNITLPLILLLADLLNKITHRITKNAVTVLLVLTALCGMYKWNFDIPYGEGNPFSYVHTTAGMVELANDIAKTPDASVLIGAKQYWPLPFYLRDQKGALGYQVISAVEPYSKQYKIIIADKNIAWGDKTPQWPHKYYRISDVSEVHVYFSPEL